MKMTCLSDTEAVNLYIYRFRYGGPTRRDRGRVVITLPDACFGFYDARRVKRARRRLREQSRADSDYYTYLKRCG